MSINCDCPNPTEIGSVPSSDCPFDIGQVQKIVVQRKGYVFLLGAIKVLASWTALQTAANDTKVVSTPLVGGNPIITPGGAITEGGGDNSTLNGAEDILGTNPSIFSADFKSITPEQEKALKALMCEPTLQVFLINEFGKIICKKGDIATSQTGIPIQSLHFGDRDNQGFGKKDINKLRFSFKAGWSEDIEVITPTDFNPITSL